LCLTEEKVGTAQTSKSYETGESSLLSDFPSWICSWDDTSHYWDECLFLDHLYGSAFLVVSSFMVTCSRNKSSFSYWGKFRSEASGKSHERARL